MEFLSDRSDWSDWSDGGLVFDKFLLKVMALVALVGMIL